MEDSADILQGYNLLQKSYLHDDNYNTVFSLYYVPKWVMSIMFKTK